MQTICFLVEPTSAIPVWFERIITGIRESCVKYRLKVQELRSTDEMDMRSVVVVCSQNNWTQYAVRELKRKGIIPILVGGSVNQFNDSVSGVMLARRALIEKIMDYFIGCNRKKMALVGVNKNASNDNLKAEVFLRNCKALGLNSGKDDIYWIDSDITGSIKQFIQNASMYDGAICSNDYVAVALLKMAREKGICVPKDVYVAGIGDTFIGRYAEPTLTTTSSNEFFELGRQAVNIWRILEANPDLSNIVMTVNTEIIPRGSTAFSGFANNTNAVFAEEEPSLNIGIESQALRNMEICLSNCDKLSLQILSLILQGKTHEQIEDELLVSRGSRRYRTKKIYQLANVENRAELESLFMRYLPNFKESVSLDRRGCF